jgi:uncharacterized protein
VKVAFADTGYWLALLNTDDELHPKVLLIADEVDGWRLVTTDWVLLELLNGMSRRGAAMRQEAVAAVRSIMSSPDVEVVMLTARAFSAALDLYQARSDKAWSLTDCDRDHA